jgi:hypothetical protein
MVFMPSSTDCIFLADIITVLSRVIVAIAVFVDWRR